MSAHRFSKRPNSPVFVGLESAVLSVSVPLSLPCLLFNCRAIRPANFSILLLTGFFCVAPITNGFPRLAAAETVTVSSGIVMMTGRFNVFVMFLTVSHS